jgi:hypothetical protein
MTGGFSQSEFENSRENWQAGIVIQSHPEWLSQGERWRDLIQRIEQRQIQS